MGGEVISMTTKWKKKEDEFADFENEIETYEFAGFENEIEFACFEKEDNEIETDGRGSDLSCVILTLCFHFHGWHTVVILRHLANIFK
ncbi:hypothetical protein L2E82_30583 [Cichorium intybus]|uniref:Uncharacterized protein n=1 Tax=Cichorium intybus TaxID=13427 RepID=A0ACB9D0X4_CICIN|nr:hypothetical protein L2E82_30583 [Cichorium intybus]